ncbi:MAG: hypothetical protein ACI9EK_001918 [Psychroserpens sp.]|jgi:hypothetical protein
MVPIEVYEKDGYRILVEFPVIDINIEDNTVIFSNNKREQAEGFAVHSEMVKFSNWLIENNKTFQKITKHVI